MGIVATIFLEAAGGVVVDDVAAGSTGFEGFSGLGGGFGGVVVVEAVGGVWHGVLLVDVLGASGMPVGGALWARGALVEHGTGGRALQAERLKGYLAGLAPSMG